MKWLRTAASGCAAICLFSVSWVFAVSCDCAADSSAMETWYGSMSLLTAVVGVIGILAACASVVYE